MYPAIVLLTMLVLPLGSIAAELMLHTGSVSPVVLVGKWFVFWSVGVRLLTAGVRQFVQPRFTLEQIFGITDDSALPIVRELGIANAATGFVGILSLSRPAFVEPVAIAALIFYGVAGVRHIAAAHRSTNETIAMTSDVFIAAVLAVYLGLADLG